MLDYAGLCAWLEALEQKSWTLVSLTLSGQLSLAARTRLDDVLEDYAGRLALLRADTARVVAAATAEDLASLRGEGYLGRAIERLRHSDDPVDADALRLLYRLARERG